MRTFVVIGAGMQGTAAAYDLVRFGRADRILLADADRARACAAAERVNRMVGKALVDAEKIDASDASDVARKVAGATVVLSCVPYRLHTFVIEGALSAGVSVIDMGNDTDVTLEWLARDADFAAKGITFVPDTGLAPGLVNSIGASLLDRFDEPHSVRLYCGGLPQHPEPPFFYSLRFSIEGLVGEYVDECFALRDGEVQRLEPLTDLERLTVDGIGHLEAFNTSSGTSTAPYTFKGRVPTYEYKTLRYPGHCAMMRAFYDGGFWSEDPVSVDGCEVVPRQLFYQLMGERLLKPNDPDLVITRGVGEGRKDGVLQRVTIDVIDRQDPETGFAAMERMTGFSSSIIAIAIADGQVRRGAVRYEEALAGDFVLSQLSVRNISLAAITETL